MLKSDGRKFETLFLVARQLRDLGARADACKLLEEAHGKPSLELAKRQHAALLRALTSKDTDDEIAWLERADASDPEVKASLANSRGYKAMEEGRDADAARSFREAAAVYAGLPESSSTLNNGGLALHSAYVASGDTEALDRYNRMLEKALTLQPGDAILTGNVADAVLSAGVADVIGTAHRSGQTQAHGPARRSLLPVPGPRRTPGFGAAAYPQYAHHQGALAPGQGVAAGPETMPASTPSTRSC